MYCGTVIITMLQQVVWNWDRDHPCFKSTLNAVQKHNVRSCWSIQTPSSFKQFILCCTFSMIGVATWNMKERPYANNKSVTRLSNIQGYQSWGNEKYGEIEKNCMNAWPDRKMKGQWTTGLRRNGNTGREKVQQCVVWIRETRHAVYL